MRKINGIRETEVIGEKMKTVSRIVMMLLVLLQITTPASAQTTSTTSNHAVLGYSTVPANVTVAVGDAAVFRCGVSGESTNITFTLRGSHGNHTLICMGKPFEDIPEALYGSCEVKNGETIAVWTIKGTSLSDNGTRVVCEQPNNRNAPDAFLLIYENGSHLGILIGCVIGGFFGTLLVFALAFPIIQKSQTLQRWFGRMGKGKEDDMTTVVTKDVDDA